MQGGWYEWIVKEGGELDYETDSELDEWMTNEQTNIYVAHKGIFAPVFKKSTIITIHISYSYAQTISKKYRI